MNVSLNARLLLLGAPSFSMAQLFPFDNTSIHAGIKMWLNNPVSTTANHGLITTWDTSRVTDMSWLFFSCIKVQ